MKSIFNICLELNRVFFLSNVGYESMKATRANIDLLRYCGFTEVDGKTFVTALKDKGYLA